MDYLQKIWHWITGLFAKPETKAEAAPAKAPAPAVPEAKAPQAKERKHETAEDFSALPFATKLEYARNGVWINKGLHEFFEQRLNPDLDDEDRREIARAYAFRTGMPYSDPTVKNKAPAGHGMGDDGRQR